MSEFDDLESRLRVLGSEPVDPAVQSRHLTAMSAVHWRRSRLGRAKVVAAFAAGIVLGGTGLASAGAMGESVKNSVADAAAKVNLNLPGGTPRVQCTGQAEGETHGQYVKGATTKEDKQARAKSNCGKPLVSENGGGDNENSASECKPPWAGQMDKATRTSLRESWTRPTSCASEGAEIETESDEEKGKKPETPPGQDGKDGAGKPEGLTTQQDDVESTTTTTEAATTTTEATAPTPTLPGQANEQADANTPLGGTTTTAAP